MTLTLEKAGEVFAVPKASTPVVRGNLVRFTGAEVAAIGDYPLGILMDDSPTDCPPLMVNVYGNGSIITDTALNLAVTDVVYSDGDGTYSATKPAGAAGTEIFILGYPLSATKFVVRIHELEKGA